MAPATEERHAVLQLDSQLNVHKLKLLFDSGNRHIYPPNFAREVRFVPASTTTRTFAREGRRKRGGGVRAVVVAGRRGAGRWTRMLRGVLACVLVCGGGQRAARSGMVHVAAHTAWPGTHARRCCTRGGGAGKAGVFFGGGATHVPIKRWLAGAVESNASSSQTGAAGGSQPQTNSEPPWG